MAPGTLANLISFAMLCGFVETRIADVLRADILSGVGPLLVRPFGRDSCMGILNTYLPEATSIVALEFSHPERSLSPL